VTIKSLKEIVVTLGEAKVDLIVKFGYD